MKRFLVIFISLLLLFSTASAAQVDEYYWIKYSESWELMSATRTDSTANGSSWQRLYVGVPSQRDGESISVSQTVEVAVGKSGTLHIPISELEAELGFSTTVAHSITVNASSAVLKAGEYVVIDYRNYFDRYNVLQALLRDGQGYTLNAEGDTVGSIKILKDIVADTDNYYVYKPIAPQIRYTYHSTADSALSTRQARVEIYTCIDGQYVLTDSYYQTAEGIVR